MGLGLAGTSDPAHRVYESTVPDGTQDTVCRVDIRIIVHQIYGARLTHPLTPGSNRSDTAIIPGAADGTGMIGAVDRWYTISWIPDDGT